MKRGRKMPQIVYLFAKVLKKSEIQHSLNLLNEKAFKYALRHFSFQGKECASFHSGHCCEGERRHIDKYRKGVIQPRETNKIGK